MELCNIHKTYSFLVIFLVEYPADAAALADTQCHGYQGGQTACGRTDERFGGDAARLSGRISGTCGR